MARSVCLWAFALFFALIPPVLAQDLDDLDDLDDLEGDVVTEEPFEAGLQSGTWELGLVLGRLGLNKELVGASRIIVDAENPEDLIFADMQLKGQDSFSPQIRINRIFGNFVFENTAAFAVGDYEQTIESALELRPTDSTNTLTEEEQAKGSYFVFYHDHGLAWYPRSKGTLLPFIRASAGSQHYSLDSNYVDGSSGGFIFSYGGGLRVSADEVFSFVLEVKAYSGTVDFNPSQNFREGVATIIDGDNRLVDIPMQFLTGEGDEAPATLVDDQNDPYPDRSFSNLWFGVGFIASF